MSKRIFKQFDITVFIAIFNIFLSICFTFIFSSLLILVAGASPVTVFITIFKGTWTDYERVAEIFVKAIPLILGGLGVSVAFKGGFWNIGAEGQIYAGAAAAAVTGILIQWNSPALLLFIIVISFIAGAFWAFIPGLLKSVLNINEVILTMMMNYIAIYIASYVCHGPFRDTHGYLPQTQEISSGAILPVIMDKTRLHAGIIIAVICSLIIYFLFSKTVAGYNIRVSGANPRAAFYGGINVFFTILVTAGISGGLCGLAGMGEICGVHHRLLDGISPGYGYTAIIIALLGRLHPAGVVISAIAFASLEIGAGFMQRTTGIPSSLVTVIESMTVMFILGSEILEKKLIRLWQNRFLQ
ncbi:MAG: ABC transporter permease [Candidatus Eremiobacterota bacterium]